MLKEYLEKSYLHINSIMKFYLTFDVYYNCVRLWRKGVVTRVEATRIILAHYSYLRFYCYYPIYKLMRLFLKIRRKINRKTGENQIGTVGEFGSSS